jgi:hypothetical protein
MREGAALTWPLGALILVLVLGRGVSPDYDAVLAGE